MSTGLIVILALVVAVAAAALVVVVRRLRRNPAQAAPGVVTNLHNDTGTDSSGAVRSVQYADLLLPVEQLDELWTPTNLERLARTYWHFLTVATAGLVHVRYTERERFVMVLFVKLLTFQAPEYEMDSERGIVRWRIERGLLVARRGRGGNGYLQIDIRRCPSEDPSRGRMRVAVEVANFYPAIASSLGRWLYNETQSRIHVFVTYGFLRSLATLNLDHSRVGRYSGELGPDDVPAPPPGQEPAARPGDQARERQASARGG